ncbi:MAG: GAF domain-containing protein [Anaerolineae bacterium]|nr:GAF domain-containing protein [Anaerolineae bacterium]
MFKNEQIRWQIVTTTLSMLLLASLALAIVSLGSWPLAVLQVLALAALACIGVTRARDVHLREEHGQTMRRVSQELSAKPSLDEVFDYVAGSILQAIPAADKCVIHLLDERGNRLYPRYCSRPDCEQTLGMPADRGIAGQALSEGRTQIVPDVRKDRRFLSLHSSHFRSLLVTPIFGEGKPIGTISLNSVKPRAFTRDHDLLVSSLATLVSACMRKTAWFAENTQEVFHIESLIRNVTDGIVVLDEEQRLLRYNPSLAHLLGADVGRIVGQRIDLHSEHEGLRVLAALLEDLPAQIEGLYEKELEICEPVHAMLKAHIARVQRPSGEAHTLILVQDQTASCDLIQTEADLMVAASRELKPALASIRGYATLIKSAAAALPNGAQWPAAIQEESARLMGVADDLAALHGLHAGRLEIRPEMIDAGALIDQLIETLAPLAQAKGTTLVSSYAPNLAQLPLDPQCLRHVLLNLLQNAIHRSGPGGRITLALEASLTDATFTISDDGRRIPGEAQARIFHGLFRSDGATPDAPARTGLGLYVSRRLIEAHGGTLWMPEQDGPGAILHLMVPLEADATNGKRESSFSAPRQG